MTAIVPGTNIKPGLLSCGFTMLVFLLVYSAPSLVGAVEDIFDSGVRVHRGGTSDSGFQPAGAAGSENQASDTSTSTAPSGQGARSRDCQGVRVHQAGAHSGSKIRTHRAGTRSQRAIDRNWYNVPTHRMGQPRGQKIRTHRAGQRSGSNIRTHRAGFSSHAQIRTHKAGGRTHTCNLR